MLKSFRSCLYNAAHKSNRLFSSDVKKMAGKSSQLF